MTDGDPPIRRRQLGAGALAAATPHDRDRVVDFLRAASISAVVLGHWLIATVVPGRGGWRGANALASLAWFRPVTWVVQVIAIFFVVGGFSNARVLRHASSDTRGSGFLARRADRLLRPTVVFVGVWLVVAQVILATGPIDHITREAMRIVAQPLWFLAVYLLVVLIAPVQARIHRASPELLLGTLPVLVVAFDVLRLTSVAPGLAVGNYLLVFAFAQELGFAYADGSFEGIRPWTAAAVSAAAFATLALLTTLGPYPVSMVGVPGDQFSNMSPPTVCILVLTVAQGAFLLAVRAPLRRWLEQARVWQATVLVNLAVLTLFLWHLSAFVVVGASLLALDVGFPPIGTAAWWGQRLVWLAGALAVLTMLVILFSPVERSRWQAIPPGPNWLRPVGILLAFAGLAGLALAGFGPLTHVAGSPLLGVRFSPLAGACLLALGWLLAAGAPRPGASPG
jgi:peptidoglycan/LPS O-acetylase OafA/YrhL